MLYGTGMTAEDMNKAQVGIASVWYEGNTCNMHLLELAEQVKRGVQDAGLVGLRFNTIGVSDGISMGTEGMSYSLQSRDLIADSIETVMAAQWYDGLITLPGCDKNMPGCLMAMGRLNRPAIMVYGGTIKPGCTTFKDNQHPTEETPRDIVSAFQAYGEFLAGTITEEQRQAIVQVSCPGAGACGGNAVHFPDRSKRGGLAPVWCGIPRSRCSRLQTACSRRKNRIPTSNSTTKMPSS